MRNKLKMLPTLCCMALLTACATDQRAVMVPWAVTPMSAKSGSDHVDDMYQIGRYYQGQNRFDQAINAYLKVPMNNRNFAEARNGVGVIYAKQGNYTRAIEAFKLATKTAPKAAHIYSNMGYAYYLQGQYSEAVSELTKATMLDSSNQRALNNLGLAYAKAGSKGESIKAFNQAIHVNDSAIDSSLSASVATTSFLSTQSSIDETNPKQHQTVTHLHQQMLAIPKDSGVIRSAPNVFEIKQVESRAQLVTLSLNVSELRVKQQDGVNATQASVALDEARQSKSYRIEVANGNGVTGMAGKVGQYLRNQGYAVTRLTNQKPFHVKASLIEYRSGYQVEANLLKESMPDSPVLVLRDDLRTDVSLRLVLGKDVVAQVAHFNGKWKPYQFVRSLDVSSS